MSPIRFAATAAFAIAAAAWTSQPAAAQSFGGGNGIAGHGFSPPVKGGGVVPNTNLPAPPALPGAARHGVAAPASKPAADMPPTEALFDAINRGDMGTAQDALSRGADIEGHNVLGMTPLELSVDLGRNDITFLLLSLRGASPGTRPPGAALASANPATAAGRPARGVRHAHGATAAGDTQLSAEVRATRHVSDVGSGLPPASVRYAGSNPGAAVPQAGFLGF